MSVNNLVNQFDHIKKILEERIILYKKRQLAIKRTIKAMSRSNINPKPHILLTMLDAHINYIINSIGVKSIEKLLKGNNLDSIKSIESAFKQNSNLYLFFKKLTIDSRLLPLEDDLDKSTFWLFEMAFSLEENTQKNKLICYLQKTSNELIQKIFKGISILDASYTDQVINEFQEFLINYSKSS
jgi:hypothetical protein